jgi:hypothetical protein
MDVFNVTIFSPTFSRRQIRENQSKQRKGELNMGGNLTAKQLT